jgi:glycosyltransferase involved in cell wall biosynthesis
MNKKKRIVIVTELFYPDETSTARILTTIAENLKDSFEVLVLTGPKSYANEPNIIGVIDEHQEINVQRVWVPALNKNKLISRFIRLILLSFGLAWRILLISKRDDIVFSVTNPAPILVLLAVIKKLNRFTLALLVHDVFPENAAATGVISNKMPLYSSVQKLFGWAYGTAEAIVVIGNDMATIVSRKIKKYNSEIVLIENWAETDFITPISKSESNLAKWGLTDKIVVQYGGNIGRAQGILEFVDCVIPVENNTVHYVFCGSGALTNQLIRKVQDRPNFSLKAAYPRSDQRLILGSCDIALILLGPDMYGLGVPSKAYNIMAAGKPILFIGPENSEIYNLVKHNNIGWAFTWDQADEVGDLISSFSFEQIDAFVEIGKQARLLAEFQYTESIQMKKFQELFLSL